MLAYTDAAMKQPFELFIGLRYTRAKRRNHFISFISGTSIVGIALGVTALITVLSVMNGFENELRARILGMTSHAVINQAGRAIHDWQALAEIVDDSPHVVGSAPFIEGEGMVRRGQQLSGVLLRGIEPAAEAAISRISQHMLVGALEDLQAGEFSVVIGRHLAMAMGVVPGDTLDLMIPTANVTPAGVAPRFRRFSVVGVFEIGMYEYDRSLVLMHRRDAAALYRLGDAVNGLRVEFDDVYQAPYLARDLQASLPGFYQVSDWTRQHRNFFAAIQTEKRVMFIILSLIVAVAAFNIVSTLVMAVTDKQADIAILRTLGASPRSIMAVFMVNGTLIGVVGTLIGLAGGIALALNIETLVPAIESWLGRDLLADDVYYISNLPSDLVWADVIKIGLLSLGLGLISTLYPAWRAARVEPAEALRYE